jgi:hypothetical protein
MHRASVIPDAGVYWWRMPDKIDLLMNLKPLELRTYLVIARAIQRDRNKGLIAMRQIQERAHSGSLGRTKEAVDALCNQGFFSRHNPRTEEAWKYPQQWKSRPVEYRLNFTWKQRDVSNCSAPGERNRSAGGEQHSEPSDSSQLRERDLGKNLETCKADYGHASAKSAEASQYGGTTIAETPKTEDLGVECRLPPGWTEEQPTSISQGLSAFMDGEQPPAKLLSWTMDLASRYELSAADIHRALNAAWQRNASPGTKNRPRQWKWFYEVLRNAFIAGYSARMSEAP